MIEYDVTSIDLIEKVKKECFWRDRQIHHSFNKSRLKKSLPGTARDVD